MTPKIPIPITGRHIDLGSNRVTSIKLPPISFSFLLHRQSLCSNPTKNKCLISKYPSHTFV